MRAQQAGLVHRGMITHAAHKRMSFKQRALRDVTTGLQSNRKSLEHMGVPGSLNFQQIVHQLKKKNC